MEGFQEFHPNKKACGGRQLIHHSVNKWKSVVDNYFSEDKGHAKNLMKKNLMEKSLMQKKFICRQ